jgi:hypothetical protein
LTVVREVETDVERGRRVGQRGDGAEIDPFEES